MALPRMLRHKKTRRNIQGVKPRRMITTKYIEKSELQSYVDRLVAYANSLEMAELQYNNQSKWNLSFAQITEEINRVKKITLNVPESQEKIKVKVLSITTKVWQH